MAKVHLDFGHGGKDPGAMGNGLKERDITLAVGLKVGEILKKHNVGVVYSRTIDTFVELSDRAKKANNAKADIFVSIHVNSATNTSARGVETFSYPNSSKGAILARDIQDSIIQDKIFTANRGTKTANFAVLRLTTMPAALVELGFISNSQDAKILRIKQSEMAKSVAKGILKNSGIKYVDNNSPKTTTTNILGKATATIGQMKTWAKNKGANQKFIDLAPLFYKLSEEVGINPIVTYTQSAKETGYMNFGGVLDVSYKNPCGMKGSTGGGDKDPNAHKRFKNWEEGIQAQVDHLALYAGAPRYPKADTPDPRHFNFIKGTAKTVESLGGKWAPSKVYGESIVKMMNELESVEVKETEESKLDTIKILLHGKEKEVKGIKQNKVNYIPVRFLEELGYQIGWKDKEKVVTIEYKGEK